MTIYVMGDPKTDGPVKIGTTRDLPARLAAIRSGTGAVMPPGVNPKAVEVLYDYPGGRELETELHRHHARHRLVGEWFDLTPDEAHDVVLSYLSWLGTASAAVQRGIACGCFRCQFEHPPEMKPGDRPELVAPSRRLVAAIAAMTHARLGVDLSDSWGFLPASHCDIDRAVQLLGTIDYHARHPSTP